MLVAEKLQNIHAFVANMAFASFFVAKLCRSDRNQRFIPNCLQRIEGLRHRSRKQFNNQVQIKGTAAISLSIHCSPSHHKIAHPGPVQGLHDQFNRAHLHRPILAGKAVLPSFIVFSFSDQKYMSIPFHICLRMTSPLIRTRIQRYPPREKKPPPPNPLHKKRRTTP